MIKQLLLCVCLLSVVYSYGQQKKQLTFDEMTSWESIKSKNLSNHGNYVTYETAPLRGDSKVIIFDAKNQKSDTIYCSSGAKVNPGEQMLIARLKLPYDTLRQKKIDKVSKKKMPKDSVIVYSLIDNKIKLTLPKVKNYKVARDNGDFAAILLEQDALKVEAPKDTTQTEEPQEKPKKKKSKKKEEIKLKPIGDELILVNGLNMDTVTFSGVTEYIFSRDGSKIAFIQAFEDSLKRSEVVLFDTKSTSTTTLLKEVGTSQKITFSDNGQKLALLFSNDTIDTKRYTLYQSVDAAPASVLVDSLTAGIPEGWNVSENGRIRYSKDASRIFMGTAEMPRPEPKDTIPADEVPGLDLWSWSDLRLQPEQKLDAKSDRNKTYKAVYDLNTSTLTQLTTAFYEEVQTTKNDDGDYAIINDSEPYSRASNWTGRWANDIYLTKIGSGNKTLVVKDVLHPQLSPEAKYVLWYNDQDTCLYSYSIADQKISCLNSGIPFPIYDELDDHPAIPRPHGLMGWTKDDEAVLIYDRFDIWKVDPRGEEAPVCLSNNYGREHHTTLRYIALDRELTFIPDEVYLTGTDVENNDNAYLKMSTKKQSTPKVLYKDACMLGRISKAKHSDQILWSRQTVSEYPDIQLSDLSFKKPIQVSEMNPQQSEYNWATVETIEWSSFRGEKLKGLIYKPENFDPNKKYPVMFYFYERNFNTQHRYYAPAPSRSTINRTFYASNDYIVFVPDITYIDGYPGQSSYDAIVSGAQALIERFEWVNEKKMALSGQSWGGYQTAYLVTQTDMFAAGMAGAPVSNMTSAYGGIRWGSGLNRMFQYEKTQSRIGGTLWEKPMQYIENSPLFYAPKVNTPLLIMHNDNDGAVPWYQGIEYFVALRRLDKPAWMVSYNNEPHNLKGSSIANRLDLSIRMKQFFDHYLKDTEAPRWMVDGIPAVDKGRDLGY